MEREEGVDVATGREGERKKEKQRERKRWERWSEGRRPGADACPPHETSVRCVERVTTPSKSSRKEHESGEDGVTKRGRVPTRFP